MKVYFGGVAFLPMEPQTHPSEWQEGALPSCYYLPNCVWKGAGILANQSFRQAILQIVLGFLIKTVGSGIMWQSASISHLTIALTIYQQ